MSASVTVAFSAQERYLPVGVIIVLAAALELTYAAVRRRPGGGMYRQHAANTKHGRRYSRTVNFKMIRNTSSKHTVKGARLDPPVTR